MTTIESVYGRLRDLMTDDFEKVSSRQYKAASDPFSFDLQPRSDFDAWYVVADREKTRFPAQASTGLIDEVSLRVIPPRHHGADAGGCAPVD